MVAVCDITLRFHPPPGIDGMVMTPAASNDTLPARTIKNPVMAGYIEGTTKYDMLTAIDHYQHVISRRLCSTSMFSLSICISSSEHHHWIHASNSLCSFLAGEYASAAPPDSSIIDSDAVAFRTMRHQLALERGEIDYESEGDFFNSFCDFTGSEGDFLIHSVTSMPTLKFQKWKSSPTKTSPRWKISAFETDPQTIRQGTHCCDHC